MARPTKKTDEKLKTAVTLAEFGLTDLQIAKAIDVDRTTLSNWKRDNPEFFDTLKKAKAKADEKVEKSLLKRAVGFSYVETQVRKDENNKIISTTEIKKRIAPDTVACIFWLKNRRPEQWRDKPELQTDENEIKNITINIKDSRVNNES